MGKTGREGCPSAKVTRDTVSDYRETELANFLSNNSWATVLSRFASYKLLSLRARSENHRA